MHVAAGTGVLGFVTSRNTTKPVMDTRIRHTQAKPRQKVIR